MPKATDVFEFDPDCDTDSVKHIMAEVEYHIMQQNKDNQLHQLLQVDNTTPSDVLQPDVIEEEDRKPTLSKQRKILWQLWNRKWLNVPRQTISSFELD